MSAPGLNAFSQELRPYQRALVDDALAHVDRVAEMPDEVDPRQRRVLYALPCGCGKGSAELDLLRTLRADGLDAWIYTPTHEVLRGYLERCGFDPSDAGRDALIMMGRAIFCTTPTTARNRIAKGLDAPPDVILYDEVHHAVEDNEVSGTIFGMAQLSAWIGFTATPFRGSPRGTVELQKAWPDQVEVLNIPEAVAQGFWALPTFEVVGLVDDDAVKVAGGDFQASAVTRKMRTRIDDLAALVMQRNAARPLPTAVVVPSREVAGLVVEALDRLRTGSAVMVDGDTPPRARGAAYTLCREMSAVLVAVQVISEGVDFPWLRRIVDARPTLSPVSWVQLLGRITRPGPERPEYITVCRNLERHAYLLGGLVPRSVVKAAQEEFGKPSKRAGHRSVGLEALSRFKPISVPLLDGVRGTMFLVYSVEPGTGRTHQWCTVLDPTAERTITGRRTKVQGADGNVNWGTWEAAPLPEDLSGFATSQNTQPMSDKMRQWWQRAAARYGLDPAAKVSRRQFEALPLLSNLRQSIGAIPVEA